MKMIKKLIRFIFIFHRILYFFFKKRKTEKKLAFISRQSDDINIDFKYLIDDIKSRYPNYEIYVSCNMIKNKILYFFVIIKDLFHIANSSFVVTDGYSLAISIFSHKEDLQVLQIWHTMGSLKNFGYQAADKEEGKSSLMIDALNMHGNYTYAISSSTYNKKQFANSFGMSEEKIVHFLLPRVDYLMDAKASQKAKEKIYFKYPQLKEKPNILYAPTFRKDEQELQDHINGLISNFNFEKYNLIVSLHPLSKIEINDERIVNNSDGISSIDFLFVTTLIISDYSSIVYEALCLDIDVFLYVFDLEDYEQKRSLAIDLDVDYKGHYYKNINDLLLAINNHQKDDQFINYLKEKYIPNRHEVTKRIVDFIFERIQM